MKKIIAIFIVSIFLICSMESSYAVAEHAGAAAVAGLVCFSALFCWACSDDHVEYNDHNANPTLISDQPVSYNTQNGLYQQPTLEPTTHIME